MPRTVVLLLVAACLGLAATGADAEPVELIRSNGPQNRINVAILARLNELMEEYDHGN